MSILLLGGLLLSASPAPPGLPDGCDDLSAVAAFTQFAYQAQMQVIWDTLLDPKDPSSACTGCHPNAIGAGSLGLGPEFSYGNLFAVPSPQLPSILRVAPGLPEDSLLFQKLNCDQPAVGSRMPPGGSLSLAQQALIRDWIRHGAPLSRLGFEDR